VCAADRDHCNAFAGEVAPATLGEPDEGGAVAGSLDDDDAFSAR
jgi:hypothetical protein